MNSQAFISWSGPIAREKGLALRQLLRDVLPDAKVFMSDQDITPGSLWLNAITSSLETSVSGVIVVTPQNVASPWLHFEAGALSNRVERRMVIPLLAGVPITALSDTPLSAFQALPLTKENVFKVCKLFAESLDIKRGEADLLRSFDMWWGQQEESLTKSSIDLEKAPPSLDDVIRSLSRLQGFAKAQSDALAKLLDSCSDIAAGIVGQGPLATASAAEVQHQIQEYASKAIRESRVLDEIQRSLSQASNTTLYRVMIKGESWIGQFSFPSEPKVGDLFAMSNAKLRIEEVLYDPINDPTTPDNLVVTTRA